MDTLRTPDDRFVGLPDYPFDPHYAEIDDGDGGTLRVHYVDEGPADAAPVLLMHGEPSWSYLYRSMIPPLVAAGHRVVAPDLVGFGRSDKPTEQTDYTYARHVAWMQALLFDHLDLRDITLLRPGLGRPDRPAPRGRRSRPVRPGRHRQHRPARPGTAPPATRSWRGRSSPRRPSTSRSATIIGGATVTDLPPAVVAAYDAPFPDDTYKAGARIFPTLVPTRPDDPATADNEAAWEVLSGVRQAVPVDLQRQRSGDRRRRRPLPGQGARGAGSVPRDHRGRGPLPAGGQGHRVGRPARRLHRPVTA